MKHEADFVIPLNKTESTLLLLKGSSTHILQTTHANVEDQEDVNTHQMFTTSDGAGIMDSELLSWLYWVAVKMRADIRDMPQQHCIDGIDIAHAEKVISESLSLFLHP